MLKIFRDQDAAACGDGGFENEGVPKREALRFRTLRCCKNQRRLDRDDAAHARKARHGLTGNRTVQAQLACGGDVELLENLCADDVPVGGQQLSTPFGLAGSVVVEQVDEDVRVEEATSARGAPPESSAAFGCGPSSGRRARTGPLEPDCARKLHPRTPPGDP